jgi:hypothetical protein
MSRKKIEYGESATLAKSYAGLCQPLFCLMKAQALCRSYEIGRTSSLTIPATSVLSHSKVRFQR